MLKIENTEVLGWEAAIRGMRNPMNSWGRSDSEPCNPLGNCFFACDQAVCEIKDHFHIGPNDLDLMTRLRNAGTDHRKFMRMIVVYCDITAPLYWWKEFDTYKVGTVANSCSTMHKIAAKEFTLEDFSCEHLIWNWKEEDPNSFFEYPCQCEHDAMAAYCSLDVLLLTIRALNENRKAYLETKDKKYWWQMIQLLPSSYNQRRTVMLNYEVLAGIYPSRKNHKLDEWRVFCDWIESLPYSEIITGEQKDAKNFIGTPAAMGLSFNDQRKLCGIPPISHEIVMPDTPEMLKEKLNIASPSEAVRGKRWLNSKWAKKE